MAEQGIPGFVPLEGPIKEETIIGAMLKHGIKAGPELSAFLRDLKRPRKPGDTRTMKDMVDEFVALEKATTAGTEPQFP